MLSMLFANYPQPKLTFVIEPGGYLQWQEINFSAISIATAKAGTGTVQYERTTQ